MAPNLLLASNSPRRRQLLGLTGWDFVVRPVDIDESPNDGEAPTGYVLRLAREKALAAGKFTQHGQMVLAADTTVTDTASPNGGSILGKPVDADDARRMLRDLRGRDHSVYTAIAIHDPHSGRVVAELCSTRVWMREYTDTEVENYIASGDPFDKAGAYAIQNAAFHPVERIEGCYSNVVGLPVCRVVAVLQGFGLTPPNDSTRECQPESKFDCQIYRTIQNNGN